MPATFIIDAVQVCTNEWTDKKNIVCTTVEYWSAWKWKKILTYATAWMNLKDIKWIGRTENPNTMWLHLLMYEVHRVVRIIQPESRRRKIVARSWRAGGIWCYCLMGIGFQFCKRKGVLEMNGGDSITLWIYLLPLKDS